VDIPASASPQLRPIEKQDFAIAAQLIGSGMNSDIPTADLQKIFSPPWWNSRGDSGFCATSKGQIIGLGPVIPSLWNGKLRLNLSSWYLDPAWRGRGLGTLLLQRLLDRKVALYGISASNKMGQFLRKHGFTVLDETRWTYEVQNTPSIPASRGNNIDQKLLSTFDQRIFKDHLQVPIQQIFDQDTGTYIVAGAFPRKIAGTYFHIHYTNHYELLSQHPEKFSDILGAKPGDVWVVDSRFITKPIAGGMRTPLKVPRFAVLADLQATEFNSLYTEAVLLPLKI
jgi:hypothetical protein